MATDGSNSWVHSWAPRTAQASLPTNHPHYQLNQLQANTQLHGPAEVPTPHPPIQPAHPPNVRTIFPPFNTGIYLSLFQVKTQLHALAQAHEARATAQASSHTSHTITLGIMALSGVNARLCVYAHVCLICCSYCPRWTCIPFPIHAASHRAFTDTCSYSIAHPPPSCLCVRVCMCTCV